ncbi:hypothetical protein CPB83DRAFT_863937 [Crepidotus variabilis]|uniref:DUF6699 domain-containing protein n=1 Tax=Crepidotus variabilis TaxID=179855 RepID=A0A9P6JIY6_9AGAR|nr:hypothetical protein CPB83DRAFT_863937 [Crepidotus variabilis]
MPGKHVHFDLEEEASPIMYAYTPSPAFSTPSLPISEINITPPTLGSGSPYHYKPLPELSAVVLHTLLSVGSPLSYDLTTPPVPNAAIRHPFYPIADTLWDQPATNPPVPFMEVECALLPWKITVVPSQHSRHTHVTFNDIFGAIYHSLRKQVTEAEFCQVKSSTQRTQIESAYKRRYKRLQDYSHYERERDSGLRRVDFLGESVMFEGLSCNIDGRAQWTLLTSRPKASHLP